MRVRAGSARGTGVIVPDDLGRRFGAVLGGSIAADRADPERGPACGSLGTARRLDEAQEHRARGHVFPLL